MVPAVAGALISAGSSAVSQVGNWLGIGQKKQDKRQIEQQGKLTEMQIKANKEMADYQNEKSMELWNKTDAKAQMAKYKEAGLNPALMYEGSGAGGTISSGASTSGVSGGQAADAAATQNAGTAGGMAMMQTAMMGAQIKLIEAQAKKTETEAANMGTDGIDTAVKNAGIEGIQQQIAKAKAEIDNIELNTEIGTKTKASQIKIAEEEAVTGMIRNMLMAEQKDNILSGTEKNRSDIQKNNSEMAVNEAKIKQMSQQILQGWEGLDQNEKRIRIEKFGAEIKANYPGVWNVAGKAGNDFLDGINQLMGLSDYKKHEIKNVPISKTNRK